MLETEGTDTFVHALSRRYASEKMKRLWSDDHRYTTWRKHWYCLARCQKKRGIPITDEQIAELENERDRINYGLVRRFEAELRHDVLAHVRAYATQCPEAAPIIHLGATSCDITDNADLIIIRDALEHVALGLARVIHRMMTFARETKEIPTLGYTHLQPAQPTTVGKRACMWAFDLVTDLRRIQHLIRTLPFRGLQGAVGTQASYLALFEGNPLKVLRLNNAFARACGFRSTLTITGQTYPRKLDSTITECLASLGASCHKIGLDLRLLASKMELEEPFEEGQRGSSAMPYKRNPMRSERVCSIGRYLMAHIIAAYETQATQMLERSLDDSALRRMHLPECFLAADAILRILQNVFEGIIVNRGVIARNLAAELPFLISEEIIQAMVRHGGNRQKVHEQLAIHSHAASRRIKDEGQPNDLLERIRGDAFFTPVLGELEGLMDPRRLTGLASRQVNTFWLNTIVPLLNPYEEKLEGAITLNV